MKYYLQKLIRYLVDKNLLGIYFINWTNFNIIFDPSSARIYQVIGGKQVFIGNSKHALPIIEKNRTDLIEWLCSEVYYKNYLPKTGDVVLDIGTGYGHEIVWLTNFVNDIKVICVEPNPEVFGYLRLNTAKIKNIQNLNLYVGDKSSVIFPFSANYASSHSNVTFEFGWEVNGIRLDNIAGSYEKIDLLKVNIEGGELELFEKSIAKNIKRIIVSCHDFRAKRGDGDSFYTYDKVRKILKEKGYNLSDIRPKYYPNVSWASSVPFWIYAEKSCQ